MRCVRNMRIVDANVILRYVLHDHEDFYRQAKILMEEAEIFIPVEIVAEVVYVLEKVYQAGRDDIREMIATLGDYPNLTFHEHQVVMASLRLFCEHRIDFIDAVLCAYHRIEHAEIHTFDKRLIRLLGDVQA